MSKYEILIHVGKIRIKTVELKAKEQHKKYLYLDNILKVEKGYIKALEDMEIKLLSGEDKR